MRKSLNMLMVMLVLVFSFSGCTDRGSFNGKTYSSYGLFDENKLKNRDVQYEVAITPLIVSGIVFLFVSSSIGILAFIVTIGWFLWVPSDTAPSINNKTRGLIQ